MKAQWKDGQYGLISLDLPGGFRATVIWDSMQPKDSPDYQSGYKVSFERVTIKAHFLSIEEAKTAAENLARRKLTEALESL
jgi:hypothetical protein